MSATTLLLLALLGAEVPASGAAPREATRGRGPVARPGGTGHSKGASDSLEALVKAALATHPTLRQIEARIREARARAPQRRSLPDPRLGVMLDAMPLWPARFDASPMTGLQLTLTQAIPWPSRLSLAARMERRGARVERALLDEARLRLAAAIRLAAIEIAYHEGDDHLARERAKVLDRLIALVTERYRVQQASLADLLKGRLARSRIEDQVLQIALRRDRAAARVNALAGRSAAAKAPAVALPQTPTGLPSLDELLSQAGRQSPLLASHRARVAMQRVRRLHARTGYFPDFAVTLGYRYRQDSGMDSLRGRDFWSLGVSVSIPLFSIGRTRAAVREAEAAISREEHGYQAALLEVSRELRTLRDAIARQEARRRIYETRILPEARAALQAATQAYITGKGDFLSMLGLERSLFEDEARLLEVRTGLASDWERLRVALGATPGGGAP